MVTRVTWTAQSRPIVDESVMTNEFRRLVQTLVDQSTIIGTGSPEGVVDAIQGQRYMDDTGTAGAITYIKRDNDDGAGDAKKGWILT